MATADQEGRDDATHMLTKYHMCSRQAGRQADREASRQAGRQTHGQKGRQTGRQTRRNQQKKTKQTNIFSNGYLHKRVCCRKIKPDI